MAQLPTREEIELVMVGAEVSRRLATRRMSRVGQPPVASVLTGLCATPQEATRALKMLESYGAKIEPMMEEVGAL